MICSIPECNNAGKYYVCIQRDGRTQALRLMLGTCTKHRSVFTKEKLLDEGVIKKYESFFGKDTTMSDCKVVFLRERR